MKTRIPPPRNALVSFHYYRDYDLNKLSNLRLIGDSGAFSALSQGVTLTVGELAAWAKQWSHRLAWVASLDVIGNAEATRRNWHEMFDTYGIRSVPTIHFGTDPKALGYYARKGVDFVGLGGMVGTHHSKQLRWLVQVMRYARTHHPEMKFHGWGVTSDQITQLPFYSVDSSGWTSAVRYGRVQLRDPRSGKLHSVKLDGKSTYDPVVSQLLRDSYGVNPTLVSRSASFNRDEVVRIAALSSSATEQIMRRKHGVIPAPSYGLSSPVDGPTLHLVNVARDQMEQVNQMAGPHLHLADAMGGGGRVLEAVNELNGEPA